MKDMLFSAEPILELNRLVEENLAPHLFLCCNYNPLPATGLSNDGKYYPAIANLYRVVSDCSCVIKRLNRFQCPIITERDTVDKLNNVIDIVDMLRSVLAHNNSIFNGRREAERIDDYHCWVQKKLGKREPDCPDDYASLLTELQAISENLYSLLEKYILAASNHPDKSAIIKEWETYIIDWYCGKNVKRDIFLGVLEEEYLARLPLTKVDRHLPRRVALWIQNYYTKETQINNLRKAAKELQNEKLNAHIDKLQCEIDNLIASTEQEYKNTAPFCFVDKLFVDLKVQLAQTLENNKCSMLPEVLLQKQIQILFDPVSIPVF